MCRVTLQELLRVLKYKVQFDILEKSLKDDDYITSVVADIDTKLIHIDQERKEINESLATNSLLSNTRRLIALRRTSNELDRINSFAIKYFKRDCKKIIRGCKNSSY